MPITKRYRGEIAILGPSREVTAGSGLARPLDLKGRPLDNLGDLLSDMLNSGRRKILLDLSSVNFLDSAGLGELVRCRKRTLERQGDLKILHARSKVRDLFIMTRLVDIFELYDDEEAAVRSFDRCGPGA